MDGTLPAAIPGSIREKLHAIYAYPARFVWRIPALVIKEVIGKKIPGCIFDPFAGSGTVAVEAFIHGRASQAWDINPILHILVDAKVKLLTLKRGEYEDLERFIISTLQDAKKNNDLTFLPDDSLKDWWPEDTIWLVSKLWEVFNNEFAKYDSENHMFKVYNPLWSLYAVIALYISRKLSLSDDSIYKYFRSKYKREELRKKLRSKPVKELALKYAKIKLRDFKRILEGIRKNTLTSFMLHCSYMSGKEELYHLSIQDLYPIVNAPIDVLNSHTMWPENIAAVITSPPYLMAHEYIRSFKYDLVWMGIPLSEVRKLRKLEIPYRRDVPSVDIRSKTYTKYLAELREVDHTGKFVKIYENYFRAIVYVFNKCAEAISDNGLLTFFVGSASLRGISIPIYKILEEHLTATGMIKIKKLCLDDTIVRRRLFKGRNNKNPNGITREYLRVFSWKP